MFGWMGHLSHVGRWPCAKDLISFYTLAPPLWTMAILIFEFVVWSSPDIATMSLATGARLGPPDSG